MSSSNSQIIATFTFEVFLHIIECIVTVQQMVEYMTLHMGSANNCYSEVFLDVFFFLFYFAFHLLTWITFFISEAICDRSAGKDQSCFLVLKKFPLSVTIGVSCSFFLFLSLLFILFFLFLFTYKMRK